jgi:hypothetical protein
LKYYANPINRRCVLNCPNGTFADKNTWRCESVCNALMGVITFGDNKTNTCIETCTGLSFGDPSTKLCTLLCSIGLYADNNTKRCVVPMSCSLNTFADPTTRKCVNAL